MIAWMWISLSVTCRGNADTSITALAFRAARRLKVPQRVAPQAVSAACIHARGVFL